MTATKRKITVLPGDGIGPEVVDAALAIIKATGAPIEFEQCEAGARAFQKGIVTGIPKETIESIERTRVVLKGPLETPLGYGGRSANVTLRTLFETYGNIRPVRELPGVQTAFTGRKLDIVIVRENIEDLYAGIEYMQTPGVAEGLKLISREGCEKIVKLAFAFAIAEERESVHCATKSNIMKLTEGLLQRTFEEFAPQYPSIVSKHILIDNCAHQLAMRPEQFDVIVTTNMNGDILSDLTSGLTGGLGFAPSANIGNDVSIFEAVHGSAPDIAGKNKANPTALVLSGAMMLRHIGEGRAANDVEQAVLVTLESGIRTSDMIGVQNPASTTDFTKAVISNLGKRSKVSPPRDYKTVELPKAQLGVNVVKAKSRRVTGVDIYVESELEPTPLAKSLEKLASTSSLRLEMITNRGAMVFPSSGRRVSLVDHFRCRFVPRNSGSDLPDADILALLAAVGSEYRWMHIEKLQEFDGQPAFSKSQI
ncbi:MAG TPA: NADP-dependent isocitrate dehydrogenase [Gemmatimonadaceae bacterium]|jgi:isocitrate dehydrogenase|nr:NADP-dependent isocitrate dehydrogenase [Gemmatimonadaceae bacterium]